MTSSEKAAVRLSIVIPVYRSMEVLPELINQVKAALLGSEYGADFEMVLVNDCSPDGSWPVIERLARENSFVRGISLRKNVGQHNATMAGLCNARGDIIVIMDDDLQHPPAAILALARSIEDGNDVCYTRYRGRKHAAWKIWGSWLNDRVAEVVLKKPRGLYLSSFKAMSRDIAMSVIGYDGPLYLHRRPDIGSYELDNLNRNRPSGAVGRRRQLQLHKVPLAVAQDGDELVDISAAHGHNFRLRVSHIELIPPWIRCY